MKVALINPPQLISATNLVSTVTMPPLGLAYLCGSLKDAGHMVTIIDALGEGIRQIRPFRREYHLHGLTDEDIVARIPPDIEIIGVGLMFSCTWPATRELLKMIKGAYPVTPLVMGGEHINALPRITFAQSPVDIGVFGEGEETLVALLNALKTGEPLESISGLVLRGEEGEVKYTPTRERIQAVDNLPLPDWESINLQAYHEFNQPHGASRGRFIPMLATRGCPYQCTFCASASMWTQRWIPRTPALVVDEMEKYIRQYQIEDFQFEDLTAIVKPEWVREFCEEIERRDLKITWQLPSGTRSEAMSDELCELMFRTGCHEFAFAPESGSEEILNMVKKRVHLPAFYKAVQSALRAGIRVGVFIILGFPSERWSNIWQTYGLIMRTAWIGAHHANIGAFSPQPNTALFYDLTSEGLIRPELELDDLFFFDLFGYLDLTQIKSWNTRISDHQLTMLILAGYGLFFSISFLRHPKRFFTLLADLFRPTSEGKLGKYARSMRTTAQQIKTASKDNKREGSKPS